LKKSLEWNRKAFKIREQYNDHQNVASSLINMAGDLFLLDCPDSAFFYLNQGLLLAGKYGQQNLIENAYRHVYRYYLKKGDYRKALENYRQYTFLSDSILKLRNQGNISIIEANLSIINIEESNKLLVEQNKIQSLHLSNQKTQYILMRVLVALGIILIIFILFQYSSIRRARKSKQDLYYLLTREKSESEKIQQQTRKRELQYRFLTENTIDFITHLNNKNKRIYASPSSLQMFGFTPDEMLKRSSYDICHLDFIKQSEQTFSEMLETRREKQFVYRTQKKNGSYFWVESILNPIFDPSTGEFKEIVGVTRDINERKNIELEIMESTRQKVNLLKEIHHRVKNNFAILVSLINMQIDQSKNPEVIQSLSNLQLRIRTMALVHEMLYRSKDFEKISFPDYLRSLVSVVAGSFNRRDIQTIIETEDAFLDIGSSIPVGLIINEVMSNTYMHAFPGERSGNVRILLKKQPDSPSITLIIHDDGIGLPDSFSLEQVRTMGLQIVQILSRQLEADVILKNDEGTLFSLCFKCKADQ
jgi:PAS domain S-box-containing protein